MSIVTLAQVKGGVGKTTVAVGLAAEFVQRGYSVAIVDLDPNKHISRFLKRSEDLQGRITLVDDIAFHDVVPTLRRLKPAKGGEGDYHDVVIIDLQGAASMEMLTAIGRSDLVLIPTQASEPDLMAAISTYKTVKSAEDMVNRKIDARMLLTRTEAGINTKASKWLRQQVDKAGIPRMGVELINRTAWQQLFITGRAPNIHQPESNAAANMSALCDEVLSPLVDTDYMDKAAKEDPDDEAASEDASAGDSAGVAATVR